ncbi:OprD family porin [Pseudomonas sp. MF6767]|uniref:OprD family porin n=1 Tax=Pseudomonas sp. MF6767 TaxID=2797531 RepID=UPI0018E7A4A3|nr:OprD family porin [Pseudomonas sp. MF6767]MBJ2281688.1 OprD family porin [Pseudomonas sp. MF6767]
MQKLNLAVAITMAALTPYVSAASFISDSKATLKARNFYINQDNRDSGTPNNNNYQAEWGQGFILDVTSGYTDGVVGFGVDAIGMLGVRLDSSSAKHGNPTGGAYGGIMFPSEGDHAVDEFSNMGLTAKIKLSNTELKLGTLMPKLPVVFSNDGRLLPQTWQGGQITAAEIKDLALVAGQIEQVKGRNSSNNENLSVTGANNPQTGRFSNKFNYAGGEYKLTKDLTAQYYYGSLENFYKQHFLGLTYNLEIGPGVLKSDLRYFKSQDSGHNETDPAYFTTGYYGGRTIKGEVDNNLYSGLFLYTLGGHTLGAGYQASNGDSDFPWLNQGDGGSTYLITDSLIQKFGRPGEKTWQARYAYDFAAAGLPGATASVVYLKGDGINTPDTSNASEWERDITLAYVVQGGPLKGVGLMLRNATVRNSNLPTVREQDEYRVILTYQLALF